MDIQISQGSVNSEHIPLDLLLRIPHSAVGRNAKSAYCPPPLTRIGPKFNPITSMIDMKWCNRWINDIYSVATLKFNELIVKMNVQVTAAKDWVFVVIHRGSTTTTTRTTYRSWAPRRHRRPRRHQWLTRAAIPVSCFRSRSTNHHPSPLADAFFLIIAITNVAGQRRQRRQLGLLLIVASGSIR